MWNVIVLVGAFNQDKVKISRTFVWSSSQDGITSPPISHYIRINNNNCETRHCTAVLAVRCIQIPSSLTPDCLLGRRRAGDAMDSRRQDRHYPRKVALITSVMAAILPPIWILQSLISLINLLFSLVISLKVRRDRTQYPHFTPQNLSLVTDSSWTLTPK